jgi:cobalt-zinc-cadmium efflux system outer membrane protein
MTKIRTAIFTRAFLHIFLRFFLRPFTQSPLPVFRKHPYFSKGLVIVALLGFSNCAPQNKFSRDYVSDQVKVRTGGGLRTGQEASRFEVPPPVNLQDGLSEEEAAALALWNNAQFQADLVSTSIAQADLVEAGIIPNPLLRYIAPWGLATASGYLNFYLEALWQRPKKIAAAKLEARKTAENMVQRAFVLIRDTQLAYADMLLARQKQAILARDLQVRLQIVALARSRYRHGDISRWELTMARGDSALSTDTFNRGAQDTTIFKSRLNLLLGLPNVDSTLTLQPAPLTSYATLSRTDWQKLADDVQPELRAALATIEATGARLGWEKWRVANVVAATINASTIHPANTDGSARASKSPWPNTFAPGVQMEIPIFNRNQGRIARARADMDQASLNYTAIRQRLTQQLSEAYARYELAYQSYQHWNTNLIPALEQSTILSMSAYRNGDISFLPVLEANRQYLAARLRQAEVEAEVRRAISQLNFILGNKTGTGK